MIYRTAQLPRMITLVGVVALTASTVAPPVRAEPPGTQPASLVWPPENKVKMMQLVKEHGDSMRQRQALVGDGSILRDSSKHEELREKLIPLNEKIDRLEAQMVPLRPPRKPSTRPEPSRQDKAFRTAYDADFLQAVMVAVEDPAAIAQVYAQADSSDPAIAAIGHVTLLQGQWFSAPDDASRQKALNSIVAYLKTADPSNVKLGYIVQNSFYDRIGGDAPLREAIATAFPNKIVLTSFETWKQEELDTSLNASLVNKPMVLAGTTSDGKQLTTAGWKGKVVLVDFWATWCGPCKASLPHVKDIYKKYHSQGLEIVGVSNDTSKESLEKFLAADPAMCWPDLFDAKAASDDKWDPLSEKFGVNSIPRMFLIDKNGICRSVIARETMDDMIPKLIAEPTPVVTINVSR